MLSSHDNSLSILCFLFLALCGFPPLFPHWAAGSASNWFKIFRHKGHLDNICEPWTPVMDLYWISDMLHTGNARNEYFVENILLSSWIGTIQWSVSVVFLVFTANVENSVSQWLDWSFSSSLSRSDKTLQDIVYKLVPGLFKSKSTAAESSLYLTWVYTFILTPHSRTHSLAFFWSVVSSTVSRQRRDTTTTVLPLLQTEQRNKNICNCNQFTPNKQ